MTMPAIHRILTSTALCLAALGLSSCCHPSVEERGPVLAFSFQQNGRANALANMTLHNVIMQAVYINNNKHGQHDTF